MAVSIGTVSGTRQQSLARVELFTDATLAQADWKVVFHFEDATYDANGVLLDTPQFGTRIVVRRFGDIMADSISDPSAPTATIAQLATLIKAAAYKYRQYDIDHPTPL